MNKVYIFTICGILSLTGCKKQVRRMDVDKIKDLSGRFNDSDSQMIAQSITDQLMNECADLKYFNDKIVVAVGNVKNLSHEHINCSTFMNDIERCLVNSRRCRVVANRSIRDAIREEMYDFDESIEDNMDKQKKYAQKLGVNRMMFGSITSIIDKEDKRSIRFYQFDIKLVDINNNEVVWMGTKKIKKFIKS